MRNPDKEFELGDISSISIDENPYAPPKSTQVSQTIDIEKLISQRNLLMIFFISSVLVSLVPFIFLSMDIASGISTIAYFAGSILSTILSIVTLTYIYIVNTYISSKGQAIFVTVISLLPLLGLYIFIRTLIISKKLITQSRQ
jgi:hypothetical protein